nr:MAG TPA: hypothetical protein [Caudoviricetes sp.]
MRISKECAGISSFWNYFPHFFGILFFCLKNL